MPTAGDAGAGGQVHQEPEPVPHSGDILSVLDEEAEGEIGDSVHPIPAVREGEGVEASPVMIVGRRVKEATEGEFVHCP